MSEGKQGGNQDSRRQGRERVRQEQIKQAAVARRRKQMVIGGVAAAVVVLAVGTGVLIQHNKASDNKAKRDAFGGAMAFSAPAGVSSNPATVKDPGGIVYGQAAAKVTLAVWEDVRCPYCKQAEDMIGDIYREYADQGKIKVEFHLVDLIDRIGGGQGSLVGGAALGCAQDVGSAKFMAYHNLFYKQQPDEKTDSFGSTTNVLNLAGQVDGLRGATFDACVTDGKYAPWVKANYDALSAQMNGQPGTPDVFIDGTSFAFQDVAQVPAAQQQASFRAALDAAIAKKA